MSFKEIQKSTVDGDVVNKDVVHLDNDGQAEVVTEYVNTNADGEITSMGFTQDSFSIVGGVTTYDIEGGGSVENENTETLDSHIKSVTITDYNDNPLVAIKPEQEFKVDIQYEVGTHDLEKNGQWHGTLTYQLPGEIKAENLPLNNLDVIDSSNDKVGKYSISETGLVTIVLDHSKFSEGTTVTGTLSVASKLNKDNGDTFYYVFDESSAVKLRDSESYGFNGYVAMFEKGEAVHYDSVEKASEELNLPNLADAIEANNAAALAGEPDEFGRRNCPYIETRDGLWAIRVDPTFYLTTAGLAIDTDCHVLTEDKKAIPGLYAAGDVCGSIEEKDAKQYGMGFDAALTYGYIMGETLKKEI